MAVYLTKNSIIYIACPANVATGGPELLHQLAFNLRKFIGVKACMYYYNFNSKKFKSPVHPEYQEYEIPYVTKIDDVKDKNTNILIVPEVFNALSLVPKFLNIRKGVWFLSVDNYYFSRMGLLDLSISFQRAINKIWKVLFKSPVFDIYSEKNLRRLLKKHDYRKDDLLKLADFYMVNSYRNLLWFKNLKPIYYLSEYLNPKFLKIETNFSKKENIVAYNPKKGFSFTKKIIKYAPDIKFVPLINMTREQVIKTLQRAKVYIDFGNHPGKDRLPREAVILGCCVITGKRGSAAYFEDVPIPEKYKFEDKAHNIPKIVETIRDCLRNYDLRIKDFEYYREIIRREPQKFIEDLKNIFVVR